MFKLIAKFFSRHRPSKPRLSEAEILNDTRRAFAGGLPIKLEPMGNLPFGNPDREVFTIEPQPGHKVIVGSRRRGKGFTPRG